MRDQINYANKPWHCVLSPSELQDPSIDAPRHVWVAVGPNGSECGVEATAEAAEMSAQCAVHLLRDRRAAR